MKKLIYTGNDGDGVRLESGLRLPWGEPVLVSDDIHAELLTTRPGEFKDGDKAKSSKEVKRHA